MGGAAGAQMCRRCRRRSAARCLHCTGCVAPTRPPASRGSGTPPHRTAQGSVSCANPVLLELLPEFETELERAEGIVEKCVLRFDSLPFLPPEPYNVIR